MLDRLREWLQRLLLVPPSPVLPTDNPQVRVFRAGRGYYRYKLILWSLAQVSMLLVLIGFFFFVRSAALEPGGLRTAFGIVHRIAWAAYLIQVPVTLAMVRLAFDMRWYVLSDRSLRIREGIVVLREKTMTFANIQQITVRQNPVQRLFGIADVQVRSAGGGGGGEGGAHGPNLGESMHEAWFRGVDDPEMISATVRQRVRDHRDTGLGDPDEIGRHGIDTDVLAAARELRAEASELRGEIARAKIASFEAPLPLPRSDPR